jgi:hypothetical protein
MTISNQKVIEYQGMYKKYFGIDINFEQAKIEALHLLRVLQILRKR